MQTTTSGWAVNVAKPHRKVSYGLIMDWLRTTTSGVKFFTIGGSKIGGPDIIKSGGPFVAFFDKYTYRDYSQYVKSWSVSQSLGQYPYGYIMAQADVELDNTSRKFMPGYDVTISGSILPNRPFKLSMAIEGESMQQFVGFSGQPELTLAKRLAKFHGFDVMNYFNTLTVTYSGTMQDKYFHEIASTLLTDNGFSASQFSLDKSLQSKIGFLAPNGKKLGEILKDGAEAEQGMIFADENGIIRFWNRQHLLTTSGTKAFQLSYSNPSDIQYQNTPVINHVRVKSNPRAVQDLQSIWTLSGPQQVPAGGDLIITADFTDDDGALPVGSVDPPVYYTGTQPSSWFTTNTRNDGTGAAVPGYIYLKSAQLVGTQYVMTFHNNYTSGLWIYAMGLWGRPAKVYDRIVQEYYDQTSIDTYGRNPSNNGEILEIDNDLIQDPSQAYSLAYTLVKQYKDARKRYTVPIANGINPAWQIGDYGTLSIQDTGELKPAWVVGRSIGMDRGGKISQSLILEERSIRRYFTINASRIGGGDGHVISP